MKKGLVLVCLMILLTGCAGVETMETVSDDWITPVDAPLGQLILELPASASAQASLSSEAGELYLCDGYFITVQTMDRGDLDRTCRTLCGLGAERVDMMELEVSSQKRWDWVWSSASEEGDCVGRAAVIDDGSYHYCVSVMAPAAAAGSLEVEWTALFASFAVD